MIDLRDDWERNFEDVSGWVAFPNWKRSLVVCVLTIWAAVELVRWVV